MDSIAKSLSPAQESLYFLNGLTQGKPVYNMPVAFRICGPLDRDALTSALAHVVDSHDSLRTLIIEGRTDVRPATAFAPAWHDLFGTAFDAEKDLSKLISESIVPFQLGNELPFRATIFRLDPEQHVLLLDLHHIFGDMTSLQIVCRDLGDAYSKISNGESLKPMGSNAESAQAGTQEKKPVDADFWRKMLGNVAPDFQLTLDNPRPSLSSFEGAVLYKDFSPTLAESLKRCARELKCSLFNLLLTAFQVVVHRYSGESSFAIGVPFSLRTELEPDNDVAYRVNLLPVPCSILPEESFATFARRVQMTSMEIFEHQEETLPEILKALRVPLDNAKPALTRVVFQYFPLMPELQLSGTTVEALRVHSGTAKFDLCVSFWESTAGLCAEFEFDTDIFASATINRFAESFLTLLSGLIEKTHLPVRALDLIPQADRDLLAAWNRTEVPYPKDRSVHSLFEEMARKIPERKAIVSEHGSVTYFELNALGDAIARRLRRSGVNPGEKVGICAARSPELIAGLLGILKAGAAYVPLDANDPAPRLEYLLRDSEVSTILADEEGSSIARGINKILLTTIGKEEGEGEARRSVERGPKDLAYLMYTSGSTGNPKGVMVPHRAIVRLVQNNDFMSIRPDDIFLAFAPVSFDASTLEIWAPLLNGATLAIYPGEFGSLEQFETVLQQHKVTCLWLTAGLFNALIDKNPAALKGVRQLLAGGDVLSPRHVARAYRALPETQIINGYGPTENTTFTCCFMIPRDWPEDRPIPIGKPIRNTQVYILDSDLNLAPIGVEGELYAGGDGLSIGYWNKPELTAGSFIRNPFSNDPDAKLYKTGDRARLLPDGTIEFLGRRDFQVKIRGYRIELGEIETALRSLANVQDAVVMALPEEGGGKRLVAYAVARGGRELKSEELISQLGDLLPAHACPSNVVFMKALPIGPTGKVDRRALPRPEMNKPVARNSAALTATEARLLAIWESILETNGLGLDDNFFHSGGESLKATRTITQINQAFNCRVTIPQLFRAPTVREMARIVESVRSDERDTARDSKPTLVSGGSIDVNSLSQEQVDALLQKLLTPNASP